MDLALTTVLLPFILLVPCIGLLRWLKKGSMFNKKILLAASAIYIIFSMLAYVSYEVGVKEAILGIPPEVRLYSGAGEHVQFPATSQFGIIFVGGILLGVCWILTLKSQKKQLP